MNKKFNFKIIAIIALTILVFIYLIFFNIKKNTKVEIEADIVRIGTNYVIAADHNDNEYLLNTNEEYNIGDKVNIVMKNVKKGTPCTGEIIKIDTLSRNVAFSITDEPPISNESSTPSDNTKDEEIINSTPNTSTENITNDKDISENSISTDEEIVTYFTNFESEVDQSSSLKDTIKEKFVTIVDFLFYDGKIGNKTFNKLSNTTKLKVLEIALNIDQKIEKKFPGYKESISTNSKNIYTNIKGKIIQLYLDVTTNICNDNHELCNEAKIGLGNLKKSFSLTWDFVKETSGIGLEKLKSWYEVWKSC